jgi:hypothetical protein
MAIDLAKLRRLRMLDPTRIGKAGQIPAIAWETLERLDQLGRDRPIPRRAVHRAR